MEQKIIIHDKASASYDFKLNCRRGTKTATKEWFQFDENTFVFLENFKGSKSDIHFLLSSLTGQIQPPPFMELINELEKLSTALTDDIFFSKQPTAIKAMSKIKINIDSIIEKHNIK